MSRSPRQVRIFGREIAQATAGLALALLLVLTGGATKASLAQTFSVVHTFEGASDGAYPDSGLTPDGAGNFYGTTRGTTSGSGWNGTVFKLAPSGSSWTLTTIYEFAGGTDGDQPIGRVLIGPDGSLYGTTTRGGGSGCGGFGCGVVFKLSNSHGSWTETVLYRFTGGTDGGSPTDDLIMDGAGAIYGTAVLGGVPHTCGGLGCGVVWKLAPSGSGWIETPLYQFHPAEGVTPTGGVVFDPSGNLYGVAYSGGANNFGNVFELTPSGSGWAEKAIYSFQNGSDGKFPNTGLIFDASGNLYGTTSMGGMGGGGTIFKLAPSGGSWTFDLLYSFTGGLGPGHYDLLLDARGSLYGTTSQDGSHLQGSAFKLTPSGGSWTYTSLHDFTGGDDGWSPESNLAFDTNGNLLGTTLGGGSTSYGVIFEISGLGTCPMITLSPPTLPGGTVGVPYGQTITASGGTGPYTFAVTTGTLPAGLTLSSAGLLSGTPTAAGTSNFTIEATDAHECTGSRSYSITITASCPTITLSPPTLPGGTVGTHYSQTITASGGTGPYTFSVILGTLPAGLTLSTGGLLSGTPTVTGTSFFTVKATDAHQCTGTHTYSITIASGTVTVTSVTPKAGPTSGGRGIAITGTGFQPGATVTLCSSSATSVVVVNSTTITATTPAHGAGACTVTVTNVGGAFGSLANGYTFLVGTPFTDDPLLEFVTVVKAQHVLELRNAIAMLWSVGHLGTPHWTNVVSAGTVVEATDVQELRPALNQGLVALGYMSLSFTDNPLQPQATLIKKVHIDELRNGVRLVTS